MTPSTIVDSEDSFTYENLEINVVEEDNVFYITVTDLETSEISTATVYTETQDIVVDGDKFDNYSIAAASAVKTSQVIKTYFDINPASVANAVATVGAIVTIVASLGSAGVTVATFKTAFKRALEQIGTGQTLEALVKKASVNGWFEFQQQYSGKKARNINRKVYVRIGRSGSHKMYSMGNGPWFETTKPF